MKLFIVLALVCGVIGLGMRAEPAPEGEVRELPGGILNPEMFDVGWIQGEWEHVFGGEGRQIEIERVEKGVYSVGAENFLGFSRIYLIKAGCERVAILESSREGAEDQVMFARLSGYSERLTLDLFPAIFPLSWTDPELMRLMGVEPQDELPKEHRLAALKLFADSIDTKGTFMEQDLTFYRPIALRELREMMAEEQQD